MGPPPNLIFGTTLRFKLLAKLAISEVLVAGVGPDGATVSVAAFGVVELEGDLTSMLAFADARGKTDGSWIAGILLGDICEVHRRVCDIGGWL